MTERQHFTIVKPNGSRGHRWFTTEENARRYAVRAHNADRGDRLVGPTGLVIGTVANETINDVTGTTIDVRKVLV